MWVEETKNGRCKTKEHSLAPLPKALAVAEKARTPCAAHNFEAEAQGVAAPRANRLPVLRVEASLAALANPQDACLKARRADIMRALD